MMIPMPRGGTRPGAGRPRKFGRAALSESYLLRCTAGQLERWHRAARAKGTGDFATWVRAALDTASK
jgi:hypothetical protein